jgi:methionyl-tRNA synthetase
VNGFLTVDGAKMSKSRGTFITARSYVEQNMNPEWLRYYFAGKSNGTMEDVDLNLDDMIARVNSDLVGKFVNIASRCAGFISKHFDGQLAASDAEATREFEAAHRAGLIAQAYETRDYSRALREIMHLADVANQYVNENKPWELARQDGQQARLHEVCSTALTMFRDLATQLKPVLPALAARVEHFLALDPLAWPVQWQAMPAGHRIRSYSHLMTRIERKQVDALLEANRESLAPTPTGAPPASPQRHAEKQQHEVQATETAAAHLSIDDFAKVELRIAKIVDASHVEGADKLVRLQLDIGEDRPRQVFAGIKSAYDPATLIGRLTVMVANLAPRKMKFGISEGMVLAASDPSGQVGGLYILSPDSGATPGMKVK